MDSTSTNDDELESTFLIAIVIGSTGFVLMVLGGVYYLTRLGDVPSRKAVAAAEEAEGQQQASKDDDIEKGKSSTPADAPAQQPTSSASAPSQQQQQQSSSSQSPDTAATTTTINEELIEIYAPAGRLGVVLDTPGDGPPIVHEIRSTSVLREELQVGDRVIALDDEDVRMMSANKVSKIISRKMENSTRKFSIVRTVDPDGNNE
ncbi:expressed unknown protein [Seminavis robusta]|uniref:PDZ domain-containing protein n=1 Tax=Seminavis robusta TaxID=568900 RepID=A0A9N8HPI7_9STRA|nr:expressed unknown protein [Seminavis robusta]|eukprot:Sro905_g218470.1 n/a (205) ;mRNA; r:6844-7552